MRSDRDIALLLLVADDLIGLTAIVDPIKGQMVQAFNSVWADWDEDVWPNPTDVQLLLDLTAQQVLLTAFVVLENSWGKGSQRLWE